MPDIDFFGFGDLPMNRHFFLSLLGVLALAAGVALHSESSVQIPYDHLADRWFISQLAIPNFPSGPFYQCIAVSQTPDPTGSWYRYEFTISQSKLNDYPKLAVWPDGYYMTMNQYTAISLQYAGQGVVAFDRASMLVGQPASAIYYDLASVDMNLAGMLPADLDGPAPPAGSPAYFAQIDDDAWGVTPTDQVQIWQFHTDCDVGLETRWEWPG